tara:strand:- start:9804 stop:10025 length:222 start_codon:yes stop_codon:yes gene_type:complete
MGEKSPIGQRRKMETVKLTNGKKTIIRTKEQYESNKSKFEQRGFKVQSNVKEKIVEVLKPKKKKNVKKTKKKN